MSVLERLVLLQILPAEGNFTTLKIVRKLREDLSFDEAEHAKYQFEVNEAGVRWNPDEDQNKEIQIGEKATDLIVERLKDLDQQQKLNASHYTLFEKFVDRA